MFGFPNRISAPPIGNLVLGRSGIALVKMIPSSHSRGHSFHSEDSLAAMLDIKMASWATYRYGGCIVLERGGKLGFTLRYASNLPLTILG